MYPSWHGGTQTGGGESQRNLASKSFTGSTSQKSLNSAAIGTIPSFDANDRDGEGGGKKLVVPPSPLQRELVQPKLRIVHDPSQLPTPTLTSTTTQLRDFDQPAHQYDAHQRILQQQAQAQSRLQSKQMHIHTQFYATHLNTTAPQSPSRSPLQRGPSGGAGGGIGGGMQYITTAGGSSYATSGVPPSPSTRNRPALTPNSPHAEANGFAAMDPNSYAQPRLSPFSASGVGQGGTASGRRVNSKAEAKASNIINHVRSPIGVPQFVGNSFAHSPNAPNRPYLPLPDSPTVPRPYPVLDRASFKSSPMMHNRLANGAILGEPPKRYVVASKVPDLPDEPDEPLGPDNPYKEMNETWTACWDNEASAVYYYNKESGEATWLPPEI